MPPMFQQLKVRRSSPGPRHTWSSLQQRARHLLMAAKPGLSRGQPGGDHPYEGGAWATMATGHPKGNHVACKRNNNGTPWVLLIDTPDPAATTPRMTKG